MMSNVFFLFFMQVRKLPEFPAKLCKQYIHATTHETSARSFPTIGTKGHKQGNPVATIPQNIQTNTGPSGITGGVYYCLSINIKLHKTTRKNNSILEKTPLS
jgi:hypothetical protein